MKGFVVLRAAGWSSAPSAGLDKTGVSPSISKNSPKPRPPSLPSRPSSLPSGGLPCRRAAAERERPLWFRPRDLRRNARRRRGCAYSGRSRRRLGTGRFDPNRSLVAGNRDGEKCPRAVIEPATASEGIRGELPFVGALWVPEVSGVPSQGDGQGESQRSNPDVLAHCLDVLHPSPRSSLCANRSRWRTIGRTARGRPCRSSTFRFIPSIEITPAGRGPAPRTGSTPPQAKRWSLR